MTGSYIRIMSFTTKLLAIQLPGNDGQPPIEIENPPGLTARFDSNGNGSIELAEIISAALPVVFTIAGLILFAMLIWGGFELLLSGGDKHKAESARNRITMSFIGFILVFASFWLTRFLLAIFHLE